MADKGNGARKSGGGKRVTEKQAPKGPLTGGGRKQGGGESKPKPGTGDHGPNKSDRGKK